MSRKRIIDNAFSGQHFGKIDLDRVGNAYLQYFSYEIRL